MPSSIGHYELGEKLGVGTLGVTYRARDIRTNQTVALKVLHPGLTPDTDSASRLRREARAASELEHPNIVHVVEYGEDDAGAYVASEFAAGETLRVRLRREKVLSEAEVHGIAVCVAHALNAADAVRVLHRNLTPENIFLSDDGQLLLCDFAMTQALDAATPTSYAAFIAAPAYSAPELRERRGDTRSDLYSLGAIMFEALMGQPPAAPHSNGAGAKNGGKPANIAQMSQAARSLAPIVQRLLKPNPSDRYASPAELLRALQAVGALATEPRPSIVEQPAVPKPAAAVDPIPERPAVRPSGVPEYLSRGAAVEAPAVEKQLAPRTDAFETTAPERPRRGFGRLLGRREARPVEIDPAERLKIRLDEVLADGVLTIAKEAAFVEFATSQGFGGLDEFPEVQQRLAIGRANDGRLPVIEGERARCKLHDGETLYLEVDCSLLSNVTGWASGGFDFPVVRGRRYRTEIDELPALDASATVVERGVLSVTSERIIFTGRSESHDSLFSRLVFLRVFSDGIGISVSNRQQISSYGLYDNSGELIAAVINTAVQKTPSG